MPESRRLIKLALKKTRYLFGTLPIFLLKGLFPFVSRKAFETKHYFSCFRILFPLPLVFRPAFLSAFFLAFLAAQAEFCLFSEKAEAAEIPPLQTAQASQESPTSESLAPILVTAGKFKEEELKLPMSLSVVTSDEMEKRGIGKSLDLSRDIPNFNFTDAGLPIFNLVNIRGMGSSSTMISPSVNYFLDGVPVQQRIFDFRFTDAERIEVIRGPQSSLYGLDSVAGVVNVQTFDPDFEKSGYAKAKFGDMEEAELSLMAEGPLSKSVAARIAGSFYNKGGSVKNVLFNPDGSILSSKREIGSEKYGAISGKLRYLGEKTELLFSGGISHDKFHHTTGLFLDDPEFPRNAFNPAPESEIRTNRLGIRADRDFGSFILTSQTGFSYYDLSMTADILDGLLSSAQTGAPPFAFQAEGLNVRKITEDSWQLSEELRLTKESQGGARTLIGLFFLYSDFKSKTDITSLSMPNGAYEGRQKNLNLALFGELRIPLSEIFSFNLGLRGTHSGQDFSGVFSGRNGARPLFTEEGSLKENFVTGKAGLSAALGRKSSVFLSLARGEKSGAYPFYNPVAAMGIPQKPYESSKVWSGELGFKTESQNGALKANLSLFYNDVKKEQLFTYNPSAGRISVQNADTRSYGLDAEFKVSPLSFFSLAGNLALLEAEIKKAPSNKALEGLKTPYSPKLSFGLSAQFHKPIRLLSNPGEFFARWEVKRVGEREIDPANSRTLPSYAIHNLRIGYSSQKIDLILFAENLFREKYAYSGFLSGTRADGTTVIGAVPGGDFSAGIGIKYKF